MKAEMPPPVRPSAPPLPSSQRTDRDMVVFNHFLSVFQGKTWYSGHGGGHLSICGEKPKKNRQEMVNLTGFAMPPLLATWPTLAVLCGAPTVLGLGEINPMLPYRIVLV